MSDQQNSNDDQLNLSNASTADLVDAFEFLAHRYYEGKAGISMKDGLIKAWLGNKAKYELDNYSFEFIEDALIYVIAEHRERSEEEN